MNSEKFKVQNIKCDGCANIIRLGFQELPDIDSVDVDIENGMVTLNGASIDRSKISSQLEELGYPEV